MENIIPYSTKDCEPCRRETPLEQLQRRQLSLTKELARINEALAILEQHPDITKVMEVVSRALG